MTENAIIKMADKIREKVDTRQTFTLPEIATIMTVSKHFPDFSPTKTLAINGATQQIGPTLKVHGGDTISYTFSYTLNHADLLKKLIGSYARLYISVPVIKYPNTDPNIDLDTDLSPKVTAQTIHILKKDGSNLIDPVSIESGTGSILYANTNLELIQPLSNELFSYLTANQPIEVRYDSIENHNDLEVSTAVSLQLILSIM